MSDNIIAKKYETARRTDRHFTGTEAGVLRAALVDFLKEQFTSRPDWEMIAFAALQTKHLEQKEVEQDLFKTMAGDLKNPTAWGVIGWYLRGYWNGRGPENKMLVAGLIESLSLDVVPGYLPDGPICALGTVMDRITDKETARSIIAATSSRTAAKVSLCDAAKTHAEHIKKHTV